MKCKNHPKSGSELIAEERQRQISGEGYSPEHDDAHKAGELAKAGACYCFATLAASRYRDLILRTWPWEFEWWKPSDNNIRNLVKAGALIAAEIDRLNRLPR